MTRSDALAASSSYPAITLNVNVSTTAPSSVTNTATVSGGGETNTTNDSASDVTSIGSVPDLTITKSHTVTFTQGGTGSYTITAKNSGTAATSGTVTVSDVVPTGLTPTTATGTGMDMRHLEPDTHLYTLRCLGREFQLSRDHAERKRIVHRAVVGHQHGDGFWRRRDQHHERLRF